MALFRISWRHSAFYRWNARATIRRQNLFLLRHFYRNFAKIFGQTTIKGFYLKSKCFLLNNFSRTQIIEFSSWAVHLSGPYSKIRTAQGTNQNAPFTLDQFSHIIKDHITLFFFFGVWWLAISTDAMAYKDAKRKNKSTSCCRSWTTDVCA